MIATRPQTAGLIHESTPTIASVPSAFRPIVYTCPVRSGRPVRSFNLTLHLSSRSADCQAKTFAFSRPARLRQATGLGRPRRGRLDVQASVPRFRVAFSLNTPTVVHDSEPVKPESVKLDWIGFHHSRS